MELFCFGLIEQRQVSYRKLIFTIVMLFLYIYCTIGLLWFILVVLHNRPPFHAIKLFFGMIAYMLVFPYFFYLNYSKLSIFKKTLKPFNTFHLLFYGVYEPLEE